MDRKHSTYGAEHKYRNGFPEETGEKCKTQAQMTGQYLQK
jgi:hypothetical protein